MSKAIEELLKTNNATVIDVRTPSEYAGGHVAGSINIPLNELPARIDEVRELENIVVCCRSGARSSNAVMILKQNGIECIDGGPWTEVNYYYNN